MDTNTLEGRIREAAKARAEKEVRLAFRAIRECIAAIGGEYNFRLSEESKFRPNFGYTEQVLCEIESEFTFALEKPAGDRAVADFLAKIERLDSEIAEMRHELANAQTV